MESIDWEEIKQEVGEDAWRDDFVYLPRQSRILLSKFVDDDRFLSPDKKQVYYGPDSQEELYNASKIAYNSLMNPITVQPLDEVAYALGTGINLLQQFPGIVAIWPMSLTDNTGRCGDASGNGFHLLQSSGVAAIGFSYDINDVPVGVFLNNSIHLYYPDGNPFDITATGLFQGLKPGLTIGCWVKKETTQSGYPTIIDKGTSYILYFNPNSRSLRFVIDGISVLAGPTTDDGWNHVVARFNPGVSVSLIVNGIETTAATAQTSIPNSASTFRLGGASLSCLMSQAFVSMSPVPNSHILRHYNQTRAAFNG